MFEKVKEFVQKNKTKAMLSVGTAAGSSALMTVAASAEGTNLDGIVTDPVSTVDMFATITAGASAFLSGVVVPIANVCTSNGICLAFLSVTFVSLGVRILRKTVGAFGRGR